MPAVSPKTHKFHKNCISDTFEVFKVRSNYAKFLSGFNLQTEAFSETFLEGDYILQNIFNKVKKDKPCNNSSHLYFF